MARKRRLRGDYRPQLPNTTEEGDVLHETLEDVIERRGSIDPETLARMAAIDETITRDGIGPVMSKLDGIEGKVDEVNARVGALERERDQIKAQFSGAKWVLVTLIGGAIIFGKEILEFVGLIRGDE